MFNSLVQYRGVGETLSMESMSIAYLRAIAAQAGFNTKQWEHDDGIDLDVGSKQAIETNKNAKRLPGFFLSFQAKSTTRWRFVGNELSYDLRVKNYQDLRDPDAECQFLFVYLLPKNPNHWIRHGENGGSKLSHLGFYLDLKGYAEIDRDPDSTIAVRIPFCNRLTAHTLIDLYKSEAMEARL